MPKVVFMSHTGTRQEVEVPVGTSVMTAAIANRIRGILAECGGTCSCATCHVYVEPGFEDKLPPVSSDENDMLDGVAAERLATSRLCCQVVINQDLDGLVIRIPERQS